MPKLLRAVSHPHILFLEQLIFAQDLPAHGTHHSNIPLCEEAVTILNKNVTAF
ncbi:hypothetical protein [Nostoc sp.]